MRVSIELMQETKKISYIECSTLPKGSMKKVLNEIIVVGRTTTYFALFFIFMIVMKKFILEDYDIEFTGLSQAIIGALIMAKVVLLMELISLGSWVQDQPPIVDVILRTLLYSAGVLVVVLLEKSFEARHKADGFSNAINYVFTHRDIFHVWYNTLGASLSILLYNFFAVIQRLLGKNGTYKLFFTGSLNKIEQEKLVVQSTLALKKQPPLTENQKIQ
jgi:hypothetical protein